MTAVDRLFGEALELDEGERLHLAERIIASCEGRDPDWWSKLRPEAQRRYEAMRPEGAVTLSWEQIQEAVDQRIRANRH